MIQWPYEDPWKTRRLECVYWRGVPWIPHYHSLIRSVLFTRFLALFGAFHEWNGYYLRQRKKKLMKVVGSLLNSNDQERTCLSPCPCGTPAFVSLNEFVPQCTSHRSQLSCDSKPTVRHNDPPSGTVNLVKIEETGYDQEHLRYNGNQIRIHPEHQIFSIRHLQNKYRETKYLSPLFPSCIPLLLTLLFSDSRSPEPCGPLNFPFPFGYPPTPGIVDTSPPAVFHSSKEAERA
ncbi:unnamed protein product [Nezara viridula]|uniref:Uncharacterized protein n=1 Tax=Nezara viridula TaxID=85310 RepID=A0A9P0HNF7_NEZVI|nr:unnamed protein product [Nezara viridula]